MTRGRIRRWFWTTAGTVAFGLGLLGVFVPLLPTTPFLLLAAGCWMRGSQRMYDWLLHHGWFGNYVRNYVEYRAVRPRARVVTLVLLWGVIGATAFLAVGSWWVRALLGVVALGVTLHLSQLKSLRVDVQPFSQRCLEADGVEATWLTDDSEQPQEARGSKGRLTDQSARFVMGDEEVVLMIFVEDASVGYAGNGLSETDNVSLLASNTS